MNKKQEHLIELTKELLDDIELSRINTESLLLKISRLARFEGTKEINDWIKYELRGYNSSNETALKYMGKTGRWTDKSKNLGYWGGLPYISATIEAEKAKLSNMRTPDSSGERAPTAVRIAIDAMSLTSNNIAKFQGIKGKVLSLLHDFVVEVYYKKLFEGLAESIFDKYKDEIDQKMTEECSDISETIPVIMNRLTENDEEAISQALNSCRRIIDSFADVIYPASDETIEIGGNTLSLKQDKTLNRINAYLHRKCKSESRRKRFRQNISNLYDRVSTGVHNDVDGNEAKALFFNTYLIIGEILQLEKKT